MNLERANNSHDMEGQAGVMIESLSCLNYEGHRMPRWMTNLCSKLRTHVAQIQGSEGCGRLSSNSLVSRPLC